MRGGRRLWGLWPTSHAVCRPGCPRKGGGPCTDGGVFWTGLPALSSGQVVRTQVTSRVTVSHVSRSPSCGPIRECLQTPCCAASFRAVMVDLRSGGADAPATSVRPDSVGRRRPVASLQET